MMTFANLGQLQMVLFGGNEHPLFTVKSIDVILPDILRYAIRVAGMIYQAQ